jgi:hypothetical protein
MLATVWWLFDGAYFAVPLLLGLLTRLRPVVIGALGAGAVVVEWGLAFEAAQDGAGDYRGFEALIFTGMVGLFVYGTLWLVGMVVGIQLRGLGDAHVPRQW